MVYFPAIFTASITIGFKNNPSTAFVFLHMCRILIHYRNCLFPDLLNYFIRKIHNLLK